MSFETLKYLSGLNKNSEVDIQEIVNLLSDKITSSRIIFNAKEFESLVDLLAFLQSKQPLFFNYFNDGNPAMMRSMELYCKHSIPRETQSKKLVSGQLS